MATYADVLTQVRDMLNEPSPAQWSNQQLRRWVNDGLNDLARFTHFKESSSDVAVNAGTQVVTLPAAVLEIQHVYFLPTGGTEQIPLTPHHYEAMDQIWGAWQNQVTGDPVAFAPRGTAPNLTVYLYPTPDRAGTLRVFYAAQPTAIATGNEAIGSGANDGTTVDLPPAWVDLLVAYVEYRALRRARDPRWQEARGIYEADRDQLSIHDNLAAAREMIHDGYAGALPRWLVDPYYAE